MNKDPTQLPEHQQPSIESWHTRCPTLMFFEPDLTMSDMRIYAALDFLAGKRGWWYGEQDQIIAQLSQRLMKIGIPLHQRELSTSTFRRAIKKLRIKGYIVTENLGIRMNNVLKYYITSRKPDLPPIHRRS